MYASAKLPSHETSKVFRLVRHRRCLLRNVACVSASSRHRVIGVHMADHVHAMSVAIVLKSPLWGGKFEVPTQPTLEIG